VVQQLLSDQRSAGALDSVHPSSRLLRVSSTLASTTMAALPTSVRQSPTEGSGTERAVAISTRFRVPQFRDPTSGVSAATALPSALTPSTLPVSALTTSTLTPSTLAAPLPRWRLAETHEIADGALVARPLGRDVTPARGRSAVTSQATKVVAGRLGGSVKPAAIDVFFAEYDAPVGAWLGQVDSSEIEARSVWFVVLAGVEGKRATGVVRSSSSVPRSLPSGIVPTTRSLTIVTDLVVVIDDETGEVLVVSEFLSDPSTRRPE
jgi:hypothetical protein